MVSASSFPATPTPILKRVSSIESDYVTAMDKAVSYLYGLGHREISYLSGLSRKFQFDHRIDGYLAAVERVTSSLRLGSAVRRQTAVSHRDRRGLCADAGTAKVGTPVHSRHLPERSDGNGRDLRASGGGPARAGGCFRHGALTTFSFRRRGGPPSRQWQFQRRNSAKRRLNCSIPTSSRARPDII